MIHGGSRLVLAEVLPALATELERLLSEQGEVDLADQVRNLPLADRCRCGDDFCATLYMVPPQQGPWGPGHYTVPLKSRTGHVNVDVLGGKIVEVEILFRDEVRQRVLELFP